MKQKFRIYISLILLLTCSVAFGQQNTNGQNGNVQGVVAGGAASAAPAGPTPQEIAAQQRLDEKNRQLEIQRDRLLRMQINDANRDGVAVQVETIAHYRGARNFQISGIGLVVGLENTGDSQKSQLTQTLYANYFRSHHLTVDSTTVNAKNVALVQVTAVVPAFSKPGTNVDVTVSSIADAKSLQGGTLIFCPMYEPTDSSAVVATAQGPLSIGGFNASSNGSSVQRNAVNVGRVPAGAEIQNRLESQVVFNDGGTKMLYLDLDQPDPGTVSRVTSALLAAYPDCKPTAVDDTTISISVPQGQDPEAIMSRINSVTVNVMIPAKIVINERTGTIVVGGNVTVGPAMVVSGSLNIRIDTTNEVVQPGAFSTGTTATQTNSTVAASQEPAKVAVLPPMTTVADLGKLFQALDLKPNDVIQIFQLLKQQGALKARIELQ